MRMPSDMMAPITHTHTHLHTHTPIPQTPRYPYPHSHSFILISLFPQPLHCPDSHTRFHQPSSIKAEVESRSDSSFSLSFTEWTSLFSPNSSLLLTYHFKSHRRLQSVLTDWNRFSVLVVFELGILFNTTWNQPVLTSWFPTSIFDSSRKV